MDFVYGALFIFAVFFVLSGFLVGFLEMLGELIGAVLFYLTTKLTDGLILLFVPLASLWASKYTSTFASDAFYRADLQPALRWRIC